MASMDKAKYRVVLQDLHSELADVDIKYLKFLVQPLFKKRQYEDIKDGLGLFEALERCGMLSASKMMFLCQLLEAIRRKSLISKITGEEVSCDAVGGDLELVCPFHKMLFDLSLEITDENLIQMRYLCNVPQGLPIKDPLDLFMFMMREWRLAPDNLDILKEVFIDVSRKDLCEKVEAFEGDVKPNECNYRNALTQTAKPVSQEASSQNSITSSHTGGQQLENLTAAGITAEETGAFRYAMDRPDKSECYRMDADPRGLCLIINNQTFTTMGYREGSEVDRDNLKTTFEYLKFQVEVLPDATDQMIRETLRAYAARDHGAFDCFVLCILSHGTCDGFFGTNEGIVNEEELFNMFNARNCPTLSTKPKLFFCSYCLGKLDRPGAPAPLHDEEIKTDGPTMPKYQQLNCSEADFLFAFSTTPNSVSYRHTKYGTFYMETLTKVFRENAHRLELQQLLVKVNNEVSKKSNKHFMQVPMPHHTLRLSLYFLPPTANHIQPP